MAKYVLVRARLLQDGGHKIYREVEFRAAPTGWELASILRGDILDPSRLSDHPEALEEAAMNYEFADYQCELCFNNEGAQHHWDVCMLQFAEGDPVGLDIERKNARHMSQVAIRAFLTAVAKEAR